MLTPPFALGAPGTIDKQVLRQALCGLGDKLSKEECEAFMETVAEGQNMSLVAY
jgi:Ca2+-binding EF-hand superfamily protein